MASTSEIAAPTGLTPPVRAFLVQAVVWNLVLFAILRLAWVDQHVVGALVEFQKRLVFWYGTTPRPGIVVASSCSGADVMALSAGIILAYPAAWRRRIIGALIGFGVILGVNAVRIASLYAVASRPATLELLHLYVWPGIFILVTVAYVALWIRSTARPAEPMDRRWVRFAVVAAGMLAVYAASAPWVLTSATVQHVGTWTVVAGAGVLAALGADVHAVGNVLQTSNGAYRVTQECLFSAMLPLYAAAVAAFPMAWRRRVVWALAAVPIFFAFDVVRLLMLALPPVVADAPIMLAHGFYQLVAGAVAIVIAAHYTSATSAPVASGQVDASARTTSLRTAAALGLAVAAGLAAAIVWTPILARMLDACRVVVPSTLAPAVHAGDRQGALALLPAFQVGLLAGLWWAMAPPRRMRTLWIAVGALAATELLFFVCGGAIAASLGVGVHALVVRAWALGVPVAILMAVAGSAGTRVGDRSYKRFWDDVGDDFPTLTGAASTTYYFENEKRLLQAALPSLAGCAILKTDLWDEAKNTRIMQWAADQGARVFGIDLSEPIVRQAREAFAHRTIRPVVSDVRRVPFADGSFDAIYSMGTIEHFAETEATVIELARLLKPGGRLVLGVPNRHDPFLRPLMVALFYRIGLYGYGYEKSYSRRTLRRMLEDAGLTVGLESGVLFVPGWIRMLDLWCHTRARPLTIVTRALLAPFVWLDAHVPAVRPHGYLLASVGEKPATAAPVATRPLPAGGLPHTGTEYVVDARGCDAHMLRSPDRLQRLFADVLVDLGLHAVAPPAWHVFPGEGGVTGVVLLSESHLTIHTYPEARLAAINLYCCRPSAEWDWPDRLRTWLGARDVLVRTLPRG
jgi:S-adenosylmethionine decarboxylase